MRSFRIPSGRQARAGACAIAIAACLSGCSDSATRIAPATFTGLGILPGYASSRATAISLDGSVVAGTVATTSGNRQAFRWNAVQGITGLGFLPGGTTSAATGISASGAVVAGSGDADNGIPPTSSAAFRWTGDTGAQRIAALPGASLCAAAGVSGDGTVVVGTCLAAGNTAFRWAAGTGPVALSRFGGGSGQQSAATAISANGTVIAGVGHPVLTGAVIWAADGSATVVGKLPGDAEATATAVSMDGSVVVGVSTNNAGTPRGFRWTQASGMRDLEGGPAGTFAASVSGDGDTIVGWSPETSGDVALIWDASHGWRSLATVLANDFQTPVTGWSLQRANAISGDGRSIAGQGTSPNGQTEAWVVRLPD
jgi:probable HAF family extracellular repeat protein